MGRKSTLKIEEDVYGALEGFFKDRIGGLLYKSGMRPMDAATEDAVIVVSSGDAEQIQTGRIHLNIYVPDIDCGSGNLVEDKSRLTDLSALDEPIVETLNDALVAEYTFHLNKMTDTFAEEGMRQHFVSIYLEFDRITF